MPGRNTVKQYLENGYYHVYNRGVEKRRVFLDQKDYGVFLSYLKVYLSPRDEQELLKKLTNPETSPKEREDLLTCLQLKNYADEVILLAYCLMSNHFHLFLKQKSEGAMQKFMKSLCTRYVMYFNKRHKRVGSLYQGIYKAVLVHSDGQFLHLSRYIHAQAEGQPSTYKDYIEERKTAWVHPEEILAYFSKENPRQSYKSFVEDVEDFSIIKEIVADDDHEGF